MARPKLLIVLALVLCSNTEAEAQFWDRFTLRESFSASRGRSRPAAFAVLLPGDTTPSYSIATGLRVDLGFGSVGEKVDIGPYVEYRLITNIRRPSTTVHGFNFIAISPIPPISAMLPMASARWIR